MVPGQIPSRMGGERDKHRGRAHPGCAWLRGEELLAEQEQGQGREQLLHVRLLSSVLPWHSFLEPLGQQDPPEPPLAGHRARARHELWLL